MRNERNENARERAKERERERVREGEKDDGSEIKDKTFYRVKSRR